jgi:hypothetical protein
MNDLSSLKGMCPLYSGGFLAGSLSRFFLLLPSISPEYAQGFSTILSFVEHLLFRGRISIPRIVSFRASSAFDVFELGLRSLELTLFGPTAPLSYLFGPAAPSTCSS